MDFQTPKEAQTHGLGPGIQAHGHDPDCSTQTGPSTWPIEPVDICLKNLSVLTWSPYTWPYIRSVILGDRSKRNDLRKPQSTVLLRDISATMSHGSLTAILGGSGSGKTTLLNAIAGRKLAWTARQGGLISFNGRTSRDGIQVSFLSQNDVLQPSLTVRETLQYYADISMSSLLSKVQRDALVEQVMDDLVLQPCADSRIGRACSGGQRRRTSIAIQILATSSVVLCDEPTTGMIWSPFPGTLVKQKSKNHAGLDATGAFHIIHALKRLAQAGRTVIISIHTPRPEIWRLFDQVILLSQGRLMYAGPTFESVPYFRQLGYTLAASTNPAEFLVDLVGVDTRTSELEARSCQRIDSLAGAWQEHVVDCAPRCHQEVVSIPQSRLEGQVSRDREDSASPTFTKQVRVMTVRTIKTTMRDHRGLAATLVRVLGMAVVNGWIFFGVDGSLAGIRSRQGSLYVASNLNGYITLLHEVLRLSNEMPGFVRDRDAGLVSAAAFLVSRVAARFFIEDLPAPLVFSAIFYFMASYRQDAGQFFVFYVFCILVHYTAISFAVLCVGIARRFGLASLLCNLSFALQSFTCGYFIQTQQIPVYVRWLKWCSYMFYIYSGLCTNEFAGHFYGCPVADSPSAPECRNYVGNVILHDLGFPPNWIFRPIMASFAFVLGFYILGGVLLRAELPRTGLSQVHKRDHPETTCDAEAADRASKIPVKHRVTVSLQHYGLTREQRNRLGRTSSTLRILQPITAEFRPAQLNVIMGPEGSGKTLLLKSLIRKLPRAVGTKYHQEGAVLYNGAIPSAEVVKSATSLVTQHTNGLMSSLTVRETIQFAAELRLPGWLPRAQKLHRAEQMIQEMGLKSCADNVIRTDNSTGISGGEYRRVLIAVHLLTDPRVLLLDQPTFGLDVFTAQKLLELLKRLAARGQTIIMTLHQCRANSLSHFAHILLLSRGGTPVYSGSGDEMLPYFTSLGYSCPELTNIADFVLDLVNHDADESIQRLHKTWQQRTSSLQHRPSSLSRPAQLGSLYKDISPIHIVLPVILRRSALGLRRNPTLLLARIFQVTALGAVIMLFYAPLQHDYRSVQSRMGFVQELSAFYFVGLLQNTVVYPMERDVFYFEATDGCQSVESFLLQYTLLEVPFEVCVSLIFGVFAAFVCDLDRSIRVFLVCAANCAFILNCGESIGIMIFTLFSHPTLAVNVVSPLLSISTVLGGIMSLHIDSFLRAVNYLSPIKYLVANLASYSMQGQSFSCTDAERLPDGHCPIASGADVLGLYNLNNDAGLNLMGLGICTLAYRLVAYVLLRLRQSTLIDKLHEFDTLLRSKSTGR